MVTKASSSSSSSSSSLIKNGQGDTWFPPWFIWALFCVTSAFRVFYVMQPRNWWIMHPDEVYQNLEVAHSEMYGYGFRAYEFSTPIEPGPHTSLVRQREMQHGMNALRSYLLPRVYVMVTWVLQLLGLHFTPFLTWKVAHTLAASTLLLAVNRYVKVVFRSHDTACLAAILCAACTQLHVLGTHTLVNSLLAPPVFMALSHLHTLVSPPISDSDQKERDSLEGNGSSGSLASKRGKNRNQVVNGGVNKSSLTKRNQNSRNKSKQKYQKNGTHPKQSPSIAQFSANGLLESGSHVGFNGSFTEEPNTGNSDANNVSHIDQDQSLSTKQTQNGHLKLHNIHSNSDQSRSVFQASDYIQQAFHSVSFQAIGAHLLAGFVLAVSVYIRVDLAALAVLTLLPHWRPLCTRYFDVILCGFGALCGIAVGVMEDFRCYGKGVLTPYNWYRFNVEKDYSAVLFGREEFTKYIVDIFLDNAGMAVLTLVCGLCCVWNMVQFRQAAKDVYSCQNKLNRNWYGTAARTTVSWLLLLILYSSKGHKELRFAHNVIVLILVTCAVLLQSTLRRAVSSTVIHKRVLAVGVVLFLLSQWRDVTSLTDNPNRGGNRLAFKKAGDTQDLNQCLYHISSRPDVTGIFMDRNLFASGGYPLVHKNVPFFTIFGNNFHEYNLEERVTEPARNLIGPRQNVSLAYVSQFSNFVSRHNSQYVMKYVIEDPRYNYFIVRLDRDFSIFGLGNPVFSCRTFKVYHRRKTPTKEQQKLIEETISLPPLTNATILLHEADMLVYHGAWAQGLERFKLVLQVDPTRVEAYLPIAVCYSHLGDPDKYVETMNECFDKFGAAACEKKRPPMVSMAMLDVGAGAQ